MSDKDKNLKKEFKGKVTRRFNIAGKGKEKGTTHEFGSDFTTNNEKLYKSLIAKKRIK